MPGEAHRCLGTGLRLMSPRLQTPASGDREPRSRPRERHALLTFKESPRLRDTTVRTLPSRLTGCRASSAFSNLSQLSFCLWERRGASPPEVGETGCVQSAWRAGQHRSRTCLTDRSYRLNPVAGRPCHPKGASHPAVTGTVWGTGHTESPDDSLYLQRCHTSLSGHRCDASDDLPPPCHHGSSTPPSQRPSSTAPSKRDS